jgi:hypothetical protein
MYYYKTIVIFFQKNKLVLIVDNKQLAYLWNVLPTKKVYDFGIFIVFLKNTKSGIQYKLFFHATKMQPNSMDTADMWTY